MSYEPQRIVAPDGTELVIIAAADYERLVAAAAWDEDARDIHFADRARRDEARYPASVVDAMLAGATPLKAWREHRGLSQAALAKITGSNTTTLSKIETGKRIGRLGTRRAIAKALDVPLSALDPLDDD